MKVLLISHGHPVFRPGGGERAAYTLFAALKSDRGVEPVFVARASAYEIGHDGSFGAFRGRADEVLWTPPPFDWFRRVSDDPDRLRAQLAELIERYHPDIVHFHHYVFVGLDAARMVKDLSGCRVVMTLHEFMLICHHDGQMVKTRSHTLCDQASPAECHACFPDFAAGKFFLREQAIKDLLSDVDAFISPSAFLRDRYAHWGLDASRISVIENLLPVEHEASAAVAEARETRTGRLRFGFFGQLTPYKGVDVLLDALERLPPHLIPRTDLIVFGANLDQQRPEFQEYLRKRLALTPARVVLAGAYRNEDMPALLRSVDWMVMPSIWWENSPLVIQEARAAGTPMLVSNIGGMAEKVRDGVDGVHFLAGSSVDLASKMAAIVEGRITLTPARVDLAAQNTTSLSQHLQLYRQLLSGRRNHVELARA